MLGPRVLHSDRSAGVQVDEHDAAHELADDAHDVARLEIAVDAAALVHVLHALQRLVEHGLHDVRVSDALVVHDSTHVAVGSGHYQEARAVVVHQPPALLDSSAKRSVRAVVAVNRVNDVILQGLLLGKLCRRQLFSAGLFTLEFVGVLHELEGDPRPFVPLHAIHNVHRARGRLVLVLRIVRYVVHAHEVGATRHDALARRQRGGFCRAAAVILPLHDLSRVIQVLVEERLNSSRILVAALVRHE